MIHEGNDVIEMLRLVSANKKLRQGKHTCLVMRAEYPRAYKIVSQRNCYETPAKRLQHSCSKMIEYLIFPSPVYLSSLLGLPLVICTLNENPP